MQHAGNAQGEFRNRRVKAYSILGDHLIAPPHRSNLGGDGRATGVLETLVGFQKRLLAYYAEPTDFLNPVFRIGDDPVSADKLRSNISGIGDGDGIRENKSPILHVRLFGNETGAHGNGDLVFFAVSHGIILGQVAGRNHLYAAMDNG